VGLLGGDWVHRLQSARRRGRSRWIDRQADSLRRRTGGSVPQQTAHETDSRLPQPPAGPAADVRRAPSAAGPCSPRGRCARVLGGRQTGCFARCTRRRPAAPSAARLTADAADAEDDVDALRALCKRAIHEREREEARRHDAERRAEALANQCESLGAPGWLDRDTDGRTDGRADG
jgi:hypothetical protein